MAIRAGVASIALLFTAIALLAVKGATDWSRAFALTWYGLFGAATVMAVVALILGLVRRHMPMRSRAGAIALALPALIAAGILVWFVVVVVPTIAD